MTFFSGYAKIKKKPCILKIEKAYHRPPSLLFGAAFDSCSKNQEERSMTPRENLLRAIRKEQPESVPFFFSLCEELEEKFRQRTGCQDYLSYYDIPIRYVSLRPSLQPGRIIPLLSLLPSHTVYRRIWSGPCFPRI